MNDLNNRWFGGRPVYAELSPVTDFREACCRQYEMGECTRSGFCNFMHLKPISRELRRWVIFVTYKSCFIFMFCFPGICIPGAKLAVGVLVPVPQEGVRDLGNADQDRHAIVLVEAEDTEQFLCDIRIGSFYSFIVTPCQFFCSVDSIVNSVLVTEIYLS